MTYIYKCPHCEKTTEIIKPMGESDHKEFCKICEGELKRVYEAPSIATADGIKK